MIPIVLISCSVVMVASSIAFCVAMDKNEKRCKNLLKASQDKVEKFVVEKTLLKERVIELENAIQEGYNVSIRNEVTKVECIFDKLEMVLLMSGIYLLIKNSGNVDDQEHYIKLVRKIQDTVDKMEDPQND